MRLRALTLNIHHGEGSDGRLDLDRIAAVIAQARPHVVGLQEVDRYFDERSDAADQAWLLGRRLGMTTLFGAGLRLPAPAVGRPEAEYGVAVLTTLPVTGWRRIPLPTRAGDETRAMVLADLEAGVRGVRVGCAHLSVESADARLMQARLAVRLLGDGPAVLLGDLNAEPGSPEIAALTQDLTDCWASAGVGTGASYPDDAPRNRIDYIMATRDLRTLEAEVLPVERASDHRAVRASLQLPD